MADNTFKFGTNRLVMLTLILCHLFGMWPRKNSTKLYTIIGYTFQALTSFSWTLAKNIATAMIEDRKEIIQLTATSIYVSVGLYRGFIIMRNCKAIVASLNFIAEFSLTKDEKDMVQKEIGIFAKKKSVFPIFFVIAIVSAFLNTVISNERVLPVPIWLPFNNWNDRDFRILLIFSALGMLSLVIVCAFAPIIIWYLMYASSLTLQILGCRLQNMGYGKTSQKEVLDDLLACIKLHQDIAGSIKQIEKTFSSVFLLQITSSAVCICSIAYLMALESESLNDFAMYASLGAIYAFEIFMILSYGNEIALASDQLSFCIYSSNWTHMTVKCRKLIIIIVEQFKHPQQLVVGKIFPMRLKMLSSILNVAYSILNILRHDQP